MSRSGPRARLGLGIAGGLHEQPGVTARQPGDGRRAPAGPEDLHQPRVHALDRDRAMRQQPGYRVCGGRHAGIAEYRQGHRLRRLHQPDGRPEEHAERAFGASQELREIRAVLRQQVLQGVAGHLPGEPAELGADHAEVRRDQGVERGTDRPGGGQAVTAQAPRREPLPRGGQQVQAHHVVGRAAVPQGPRAAGVVANRAADARPRVRGRVRAEPQPVPSRGRGDVVQDRAGLDDRGARLGVHREHPVQVPGEVEHDAGADRVARGRGAAAAAGDRHAEPRWRRPARRPPPRRASGRPPRSARPGSSTRRWSTRPGAGPSRQPRSARRRAVRRPGHVAARPTPSRPRRVWWS